MLRHFTNFFKKVGFWLWSSRWLARSLVKHSEIAKHQNIKVLELGAGHGNVTREILKHLGDNTSLTAIENNEERIISLQKLSHKNLEILHGDVRKLDSYFTEWNFDIVISTLPLGSFPKEMVDEVLKNIKYTLKKWGKYIQYQYWMTNKKDVKKHFHMKKIRLEPRNFGPAFIYVTENN